MKHIFDSEFRYRPSFDTDVRKTFEKARRQQVRSRDEAREDGTTTPELKVKVLKLEQLKKASSTQQEPAAAARARGTPARRAAFRPPRWAPCARLRLRRA